MPTTSAQDYENLLIKETELPSGAVFRLKRRLDYDDYMELLTFFSKETGEPISSDVFSKIQRNPEMITKMIKFTVPKMCIEPKVSVVPGPGVIPLQKMSIDDLIFINNMSLRVQLSEDVKKVIESFRSGQPNG